MKNKRLNKHCTKNIHESKCHSVKCSHFRTYRSDSSLCPYYMPANRGYNGQFGEREGRIIRRQYFNYFIVAPYVIILVAFIMTGIIAAIGGTGSWFFEAFFDFYAVLPTVLLILFFFNIPLAILSFFNCYYFGRKIFLINKEGLFCNAKFVPWQDIVSIVFKPPNMPCRVDRGYSYVDIATKKEQLRVPHAPYHLLLLAKKYNPNIQTKIIKSELLSLLAGFIIVAVIIALLK